MKLRWTNGHNYEMQFDANDPESFARNSVSALRSFKIATERRVHRGEIHKTVSRFESCMLGVYDEHTRQWHNPEGEPNVIDTESFGRIAIARHFKIESPGLDADTLTDALQDTGVNLICLDPFTFEKTSLATDSDRVWNMCITAYQHAANANSFLNGMVDDMLGELK